MMAAEEELDMSKTLFNDGWICMYEQIEGRKGPRYIGPVTLPHDGMIALERSGEVTDGGHKGYFPNVRLLYSRRLFVPAEDAGKYIALQFDGVMRNARVHVNGSFAAQWGNGYQRAYVEIHPYLKYGEENEIIVEASTGNDSRWYTGAGIYRNVYLIVKEPLRFAQSGVKLRTADADEQIAALQAELPVVNGGFAGQTVETVITLRDAKGEAVCTDRRRVHVPGGESVTVSPRLYVKAPRLWSCESPELYDVEARIVAGDRVLDSESFRFGIRTLRMDPERGLCVNGRTVKLYGGCVHHDNGILGAAAFGAAEDRKIRLMKEAGYNAVRFSHGPMSEQLMDACDRYGLLVMDELTDIWHRSKTPGDQSMTFEREWPEMLRSMIDKAYDHPCVVMYSVGNEINVLGTRAGDDLGRRLVEAVRRLDPTRYVTSAVNGMVSMMGAPAVSDPEKAAAEAAEINAMLSQAMEQMSAMQCAEPVMEATREFSETLDVVGYNYAEDKQLLDTERFTNRMCVGSETFPRWIVKNWRMMAEHPNIIGDFNWTAWDYLGEAGIGKNGLTGEPTVGLYEGFPYKLANCGDIDIAGVRRPQSYYREMAVGLRAEPYIAVQHPDRYGKQIAMSPWSWTDCVSSWSWEGCEGRPVRVEVYGIGDEAELIVNGVSLGREPVPQENVGLENAYCTVFDAVYQPGRVEAVLYAAGREVGRAALVSAEPATELRVTAEPVMPWAADLRYYDVRLTDAAGVLKAHSDRAVRVTVEGAAVLQGFGSAAPLSLDSFVSGSFETYYGTAVLAIRPTGHGEVRVTVAADGCETVRITEMV